MKLCRVLLVGLLLASVSCHRYNGDGSFVDNGCTAATDRYVVSFPTADLTSKNKYLYRMTGLPETEMTIRLTVASNDTFSRSNIAETRPVNATIRIVVTNGLGEIIFDAQGPLREWVWSYMSPNQAFVYSRGGKNYFMPRSNEEYRITLEVVEGIATAKDFHITPQLTGGGWY